MQRKTRVLIRAAKYLEKEAREYVEAAKEQAENRIEFGRKAGVMFGTAYAIREMAATGYAPNSKAEKDAGMAELNHYRKHVERREKQRRDAAEPRSEQGEKK